MSILLYGGIARIGVVIRDVCTYKESMYFYGKKVSSPWAGAPGVVRDTIGLNGAGRSWAGAPGVVILKRCNGRIKSSHFVH